MSETTRILPAHIEETIKSIARLQSAHAEQASPLQRSVDKLTGFIGRPQFLSIITWIIVLWVGLNMAATLSGAKPIDSPPFDWLQFALAISALYITTIILVSQRYADQLAGYREQLTLELAILTEQKTSKIIQLLEEQRRDNPSIKNRSDPEAKAMATPADPEAVLDAIKEASTDVEAAAEAALRAAQEDKVQGA